ncbi:MAG: hypothetical protein H7067_01440 [Burkholderiales bacterium]|nr:hypothetical protein [Opitutaceae bacterium]
MKSAYELAMERLGKADYGSKPLSPAQKTKLAEIDKLYRSKWAEREIFLNEKLQNALTQAEADEAEKIRTQLAREKTSLEEEREDEKERVRREKRS